MVGQCGLPFGYFPNAKKTWCVVKEKFLDHARHLFSDTCVNVTAEGRPYLRAAICSSKVALGLLGWSSLPHLLIHSLILPFQVFHMV